ncbi:hypothetical protein OPQ81_002540 [Rhizoctonia solani]|nr:hypothetical protein OPQ81_002540 [Rhizoctonia solani]
MRTRGQTAPHGPRHTEAPEARREQKRAQTEQTQHAGHEDTQTEQDAINKHYRAIACPKKVLLDEVRGEGGKDMAMVRRAGTMEEDMSDGFHGFAAFALSG